MSQDSRGGDAGQDVPAAPAGQRGSSAYRPAVMGLVFSIGAVLGVLGTGIHGNILVLGEPGSAAVVPWGAALALLMALAAQLWAGLWAGSLVEAAVLGITVFSVASLAYVWPGPDQLMVPYSAEVMDALPGPAIASLAWWLGSGVVALASMILTKWLLAREAALL